MASGAPSGGVSWSLVRALHQVSCLADLNSRRLVLELLSEEFDHPLPVTEYAQTTMHLLAMVDACRRRPDGLVKLLGILDHIEPGTTALASVRQIIVDMTALAAWSDEERNQLFSLLSGVNVAGTADIYRHVAGLGSPEVSPGIPPTHAFRILETLNCGPDGLPKSLMFVEHLATKSRPDLAAKMRLWVEEKTDRMNLTTELRAFRVQMETDQPAVQARRGTEAYLVFLLQPEGPAGDRFRLSHWRQLGVSEGWFPDPGDDFIGGYHEVRHQVAFLAEKVEGDWAHHGAEIRIDFVLSRELLHLDVDQWPWETESRTPLPLGCHFPVAVRSLERMKLRKWHRAWYTRWSELMDQAGNGGPIAVESGYWNCLGEPPTLRELTSRFESMPRLIAFVLAEPPHTLVGDGDDEIAVGLRAGFPIMIWHRDDCRSEEFLQTVNEILHAKDASHLLERLRLVRLDAFGRGPSEEHVGDRLVMVWDDPDRLVVPGSAAAPEVVASA
jgi:hypothetical protein